MSAPCWDLGVRGWLVYNDGSYVPAYGGAGSSASTDVAQFMEDDCSYFVSRHSQCFKLRFHNPGAEDVLATTACCTCGGGSNIAPPPPSPPPPPSLVSALT